MSVLRRQVQRSNTLSTCSAFRWRAENFLLNINYVSQLLSDVFNRIVLFMTGSMALAQQHLHNIKPVLRGSNLHWFFSTNAQIWHQGQHHNPTISVSSLPRLPRALCATPSHHNCPVCWDPGQPVTTTLMRHIDDLQLPGEWQGDPFCQIAEHHQRLAPTFSSYPDDHSKLLIGIDRQSCSLAPLHHARNKKRTIGQKQKPLTFYILSICMLRPRAFLN